MSAPVRPEPVTVGRSTVTLSRYGFGAAPLGGLYSAVTDDAAAGALRAADAAGFRYVDTAPHYGVGLSEERVGAFLARHPDWVVSTKVGRLLTDCHPDDRDADDLFVGAPARRRRLDYSPAGVAASLAASAARLGRETLDIALVHDPDDVLDQAVGETLPALAAARAHGRVRAIGAGMNSCAPLAEIVRRCDLDCVLVAGRYNLLDRGAADELLPLAQAEGVTVVVGGVLGSGLLATADPTAHYLYAPAPAAAVAVARAMRRACERHGVALLSAALQFPLRHPAVGSVVVGLRSADEVAEAATAAAAEVPEELWDELDAIRYEART